MLKAVKVRLYPTESQKTLLLQHFGATRFIYNHMLSIRKDNYENGIKSSGYDLKKLLPTMKSDEKYSWLKDIDSQALGEAVLNMDKAYKNFFRELKKGNSNCFPKFKSRHNSRQSYQYPQRVKIKDNNKLYLPKIGWVKAKIHRPITSIKTVTVSMEADEFYASILTEFEDIKPANNGQVVGIDMGVVQFATLSNGEVIKPISFKSELRRLEVLQKQLSRKVHSRFKGDTTPQSNNFKKQKLKVQKQWLKITNKRKDFLHKTTTSLSQYREIYVEDLKIKNMSSSAKGDIENPGKNVKQKSGLNKSILQQSWGMFFEMLGYKLAQNGNKLIKVDPRHTSQTCPECGIVSKLNRESQSVFICKDCGNSGNADYIASLNILHRGTHGKCLPANRHQSVEQEALALQGGECVTPKTS